MRNLAIQGLGVMTIIIILIFGCQEDMPIGKFNPGPDKRDLYVGQYLPFYFGSKWYYTVKKVDKGQVLLQWNETWRYDSISNVHIVQITHKAPIYAVIDQVKIQTKPYNYTQTRPEETNGSALKDKAPEYFLIVHTQGAHHSDFLHSFKHTHQHGINNANSGDDEHHYYKEIATRHFAPAKSKPVLAHFFPRNDA